MAEEDCILIRGAREHNLKNLTVRIPRNKLTVVTGLSGSGKSSLAFDTLFAEGQRRYVESLSSYARQFIDQLGRPDVDSVEGLSPAIAIEQRSAAANPRSIVATVTELHDWLRLLYANAGQAHCPRCGRSVRRSSAEQIVEHLLSSPEGTRLTILAPLARDREGPVAPLLASARAAGFVRVRLDGELYDLDDIPADVEARGRVESLSVVVDRLVVKPGVRSRVTDSVELALREGRGVLSVLISHPSDPAPAREEALSERNLCPDCHLAFDELKPASFSFNSPAGACPTCGGLGVELQFDPAKIVPDPSKSLAGGAIAPWRRGPRRLVGAYNLLLKAAAAFAGVSLDTPWADLPESFRDLVLHGSGDVAFAQSQKVRSTFRRSKKPFEGVLPNLARRLSETDNDEVRRMLRSYMSPRVCSACGGRRLRPESLACTVGGLGIMDFLALPVSRALAFARGLAPASGAAARASLEKAVADVAREIVHRLEFLDDVGLGYLALDRESATLSGGEMQRIRLATQIGSGLTGVLYVLDEPTIGLHPRDNARLVRTLRGLQRRGNTVVVVEHDEAMIREADWVLDLGPGAGREGGELLFAGTVPELLRCARSTTGRFLTGAETIPVPERLPVDPDGPRALVVRGATLNNLRGLTARIPLGRLVAVTGVSGSGKSTLVDDILRTNLENHLNRRGLPPFACEGVDGLGLVDKAIVIDQSPIGQTPRSNPATYLGVFDHIRALFAATPAARARGYGPGRFSFNVKGGRCEVCRGDGLVRLEMHFLPDVYVTCPQCGGRRYNRETLEVHFAGRSVADALDLTVDEALEVFAAFPKIARPLRTLAEVGLGYLRLGQSATTLSGGEAQRVKLAAELARPEKGHTLYLLDEPTTGLHFADVRRLLSILLRLRDAGHTILVVEHNLDVIKSADWILDLGPEGGDAGGSLVAAGTPEAIAANPASHTGRALRPLLWGTP